MCQRSVHVQTQKIQPRIQARSHRQPGANCRQVALEIGINPNLLSRWAREAEGEPSKAFKGSGTPRDEELAHLKRELARVKKERDFLREAAVFFAKESS